MTIRGYYSVLSIVKESIKEASSHPYIINISKWSKILSQEQAKILGILAILWERTFDHLRCTERNKYLERLVKTKLLPTVSAETRLKLRTSPAVWVTRKETTITMFPAPYNSRRTIAGSSAVNNATLVSTASNITITVAGSL
jgi:hypothetical protein